MIHTSAVRLIAMLLNLWAGPRDLICKALSIVTSEGYQYTKSHGFFFIKFTYKIIQNTIYY
jgi:hypothetical protein